MSKRPPSVEMTQALRERLAKAGDAHKYSHGHALLLSGGCGRGGAARLAARGALRVGAGLVTLAVPPAALQENAARLDAIMLRSVRDAEVLADLLSDPRLNALAAGPGLGTSDREAALLHALLDASRGAGVGGASSASTEPAPGSPGTGRQAGADARGMDNAAAALPDVGSAPPASTPSAAPLSVGLQTEAGVSPGAPGHSSAPGHAASEASAGPGLPEASARNAAQNRRAVVLDADALTLLARHPDLRAKLHDRCILTPHDGEFARLFPAIAERLAAPATTGPAYSKVDAARDAAAESGCVILLKGPDTVIAEPPPSGQDQSPGRAAINAAGYDRAAPWLATAGSGDVLTGFIAGLLARGFAPFDAACTAAWLHVECARSFGPGLIAEDLPEELPKVFRSLGL